MFKGNIAGNPHILWENRWFPADPPLSQSNDIYIYTHSKSKAY